MTWLENEKDSTDLPETDMYDVDVSKLNEKQKIGYDMICDWVQRKVDDPTTAPFYLNISGGAGCGKSYLVKAVTMFLRDVAPTGFQKLAAPTGKAAFNIDGVTLHSLLKLPVNFVKGKPIPDLDSVSLRALQSDFKNTQLIIR